MKTKAKKISKEIKNFLEEKRVSLIILLASVLIPVLIHWGSKAINLSFWEEIGVLVAYAVVSVVLFYQTDLSLWIRWEDERKSAFGLVIILPPLLWLMFLAEENAVITFPQGKFPYITITAVFILLTSFIVKDRHYRGKFNHVLSYIIFILGILAYLIFSLLVFLSFGKLEIALPTVSMIIIAWFLFAIAYETLIREEFYNRIFITGIFVPVIVLVISLIYQFWDESILGFQLWKILVTMAGLFILVRAFFFLKERKKLLYIFLHLVAVAVALFGFIMGRVYGFYTRHPALILFGLTSMSLFVQLILFLRKKRKEMLERKKKERERIEYEEQQERAKQERQRKIASMKDDLKQYQTFKAGFACELLSFAKDLSFEEKTEICLKISLESMIHVSHVKKQITWNKQCVENILWLCSVVFQKNMNDNDLRKIKEKVINFSKELEMMHDYKGYDSFVSLLKYKNIMKEILSLS